MGGVKSCCQDARERGCWSALTYPKVAPEWYRKIVQGTSQGEVHTIPGPVGSMFLLGHIELNVPTIDGALTDYWIDAGMNAGRHLHEPAGSLHVNLGPSQLRFKEVLGSEAQSWPGEITVWVEDIRGNVDAFNALGNAYGMTDILKDMPPAKCGGELALKMWSLDKKNTFLFTECPGGWAERIRAVGEHPSEGDAEYPPKVHNPLCISDAQILIRSREAQMSIVKFYSHFFLLPHSACRPPGPSEYSTTIHFQPGDGLHQTITFLQEPACPAYNNLGSICFYVKDRGTFVRSYARCKASGILKAQKSKEELDRDCEFVIKGIVDPETKATIVPIEHVIRHAGHSECSVNADLQREWGATSNPNLRASTKSKK